MKERKGHGRREKVCGKEENDIGEPGGKAKVFVGEGKGREKNSGEGKANGRSKEIPRFQPQERPWWFSYPKPGL